MRTIAIIQARTGSTRLPGKVLLPLAGKPMLQNIIERVQRAKRLDKVVLAIPYHERDNDALTDCADKIGASWGASNVPENDLVARYLMEAEWNQADIIIRVCADNPCIDPEYIDRAVDVYMRQITPFFSNTTSLTHSGKIVDGIGAEVFSLSRLKWLDEVTKGNAEQREHPHKRFNWPHTVPHYRLDVNTQDDYDFIKTIYDHFGHNRFTIEDVLTFLDSQKNGHGPR